MTGTCQGAAGTGTLYTYAQLEGLWINAGGSSTLAPIMAAIALAESGGCSTAQNPSGATGLWQILGAVDPSDQANLTDPAVNAKEAVLKYQSQGLDAWQTYTQGTYKQYLNGSTTPDTNVPTSAALTSATSSSSSGASTCVISVPVAGCILSKSQARGAVGGLLLGLGGLVALAGMVVLAASAFENRAARQLVVGVQQGARQRRQSAPEKPQPAKTQQKQQSP